MKFKLILAVLATFAYSSAFAVKIVDPDADAAAAAVKAAPVPTPAPAPAPTPTPAPVPAAKAVPAEPVAATPAPAKAEAKKTDAKKVAKVVKQPLQYTITKIPGGNMISANTTTGSIQALNFLLNLKKH